ncbi:dentin sialophosphoprotein-like [Suncus etruscus]|uniref:dentin sialophosphoprotein-like n=1 Tax=Suncus etruscus TaxID=109475 RepID=UPI00210F9AD6|nr:dentin sialophosphoprotein-like [Suncus etruscus]
MTKVSRRKDEGGRKKGKSKKYQKAMDHLMGQCHDIEVNITNPNQQFHAVRGNSSKINHLQKSYYRCWWHWRWQWQWRWRWPFGLTVRRCRYLRLRRKKAPRKRKAAAAQISSHHRHGGSAESPSQEKVEAEGSLVLQMSPQQKMCRLESAIHLHNASANDFSGSPEYQGKEPMEGTSAAGASVDAQKCSLSLLPKGDLVLEDEPTKDANEISCISPEESHEGPRCRQCIITTEEGDFVIQFGDSDPADTVQSQAEASDVLLGSYAARIDSYSAAEGSIITIDSDTTDDSANRHRGSTPSFAGSSAATDSDPTDDSANWHRGSDANEILGSAQEESQEGSRCRQCIVTTEEGDFVIQFGDSDPVDTVQSQAEASDALLGSYAARIDSYSAAEGSIITIDSDTSDDSANRHRGSTPIAAEGSIVTIDSETTDDSANKHRGSTPSFAGSSAATDSDPTDDSANWHRGSTPSAAEGSIVTIDSETSNDSANWHRGSDANEILGYASREESQQGTKCRQRIVTTEEGDFVIQFGDSDPEDTGLSQAEGSDANEILGSAQEESQEGSRCRQCIVTTEEGDFVIQFGDSDPVDTVQSQAEASDALLGSYAASTDSYSAAEGSIITIDSDTTDDSANRHRGSTPSFAGSSAATDSDPTDDSANWHRGSDANEILGSASREESQEGTKCRQCIVTTEEGDFVIQFGDSDPEDTGLSQAEGSDANEILGSVREEAQEGSRCRQCIVTTEEGDFVIQFGDSDPVDTVQSQAEASDALLGSYAARIDSYSADEGSIITIDSDTSDDSANRHRGSTPSFAGSSAATDSDPTDDSANWPRG